MHDTSAHHYMIIAGESSGDQLGAGLIDALNNNPSQKIIFSGIGGEDMEKAGLTSLFPMHELSLMGFVEILPHFLKLRKRIQQTIAYIVRHKPDVVITIDSPGFTFRVVDALRKMGYSHSIFIHYVAPTVWAYKPKRAKKAAKLFDALLTLFAFEPDYFLREGLKTVWVGHEAAWRAPSQFMPIAHNTQLCIFAGSRRNELKRHLPIFQEVCTKLLKDCPTLSVVMPLADSLHQYATELTKNWPCPLKIISRKQRFEVMQHSRAGLIKSGTITLEAALYGLAGVVVFKGNPISAWIVKHFIHTPIFGLPNIVLKRSVMPEYIQYTANADAILLSLRLLILDNHAIDKQRQALTLLRQALLAHKELSPSVLAAQHIINLHQTARSAATSSS